LAKVEFPALLAFLCFTYLTLGFSFSSMQLPEWYKLAQWAPAGSTFYVWGVPPPWVFGVVWGSLYFLTAVAGYIYYIDLDFSLTTNYGTTLLLWFITIVLTKLWTPIFFGSARNPGVMIIMFQVAWMLVLAIFGTAVATTVYFAKDAEWWSFALFLPYTLWTLYAFILQVQFAVIGSKFFSTEARDTYFSIVKAQELERQRQATSMGYTGNSMPLMYGQNNGNFSSQSAMQNNQQQPQSFGYGSSSYHTQKSQ
jgi:translocator protein